MSGTSNMAPGAEHDTRSGCDDDMIVCKFCKGDDDQCPHCEDGIISKREYDAIRAEQKEDEQANE